MRISFVASFSPIVRDPAASRSFYRDALGLSFEAEEGDYAFTETLGGVRHFGLWPLREAAQACFGTTDWPGEVPVPQASLEFEVDHPDAVQAAADELQAQGHRLLHPARTEPWSQTITRLLSPEGLIIGICYTPWFHGKAGPGG